MNIDPLVDFFKDGGLNIVNGHSFGFNKYEPIFNFSIFDDTDIDSNLSNILKKPILDISNDKSLQEILKKLKKRY